VIDLHTGLGPWGYGELIGSGSTDDDWERLQRWYGPEVTRPGRGPSSSSVVSGSVPVFLRRMLPAVELTYLGPPEKVQIGCAAVAVSSSWR